MAKELTPIKVETMPNGYRLEVYTKKYMYFKEEELFDGLVYHAGMEIMKVQDKDVIREIIARLLAGDTAELMKRNQEQQTEIEKLETSLAKVREEKSKLETRLKKRLKREVNHDQSV